ncbi:MULTISPECIES: PLP-dependent aminotransferase family protein [Alicyclobacillus]|uniref:PLP-dependent aminotransferase family protein n=1 Tax=Alicyclobacillus acidoterrestris (strain ATCC 49025 / DSM 3922 / CIP 106132 / NCIMB 13137 / GD3B) TaxID=1356854 RepID=T0DMZ7_ALIAG|nr:MULTISPECIES: PLP-dependent aminotransferase family protein [Alicyclobacillus]EPZ52732.1 hypothetical protein N007_19885 [Alicyclobacillus acidoterrestris ATCC 49025]UNO47610.1 PLP-dependent aminotransferase family protein [Alicyclobacillus acidoterrestris]
MRLASWVQHSEPSFIREILKAAQQPDVISFAGGLPSPELFPVQEAMEVYQEILSSQGSVALQYSPSEGETSLREVIATQLLKKSMQIQVDDVLITNGSQHGLDLVGKSFINPGDVVLVESPTYLGALQAFAPYQPRFVTVDTDEEGMIPEALAQALQVYHPKFIYLVPTFQNPTGRTMGLTRREQIVQLCQAAEVAIVEDDPYSDLRYDGRPVPSIRSLWNEVIYLGTLSKTVAPGMRLGWLVAPPKFMHAAKLGMQATCLNVSALTQHAAARLLSHPNHGQHIDTIRKAYGERMRCMLDSLEREFPSGTAWTRPDGGLFIWVTLPDGIRSFDLVESAYQNRVAFVPGTPFFVGNDGESNMRLNFSNSSLAQIEVGIRRLGNAIKQVEPQKVRS